MVTASMVLLGTVVQVVRLFRKRMGVGMMRMVEAREGRSLAGMEAIRSLLVKWRGAVLSRRGRNHLRITWQISMILAELGTVVMLLVANINPKIVAT